MFGFFTRAARSPGVALQGAVYGRNFGDVLIQALFYSRLAEALPLGVALPFAAGGFLRDFNETVAHIRSRPPAKGSKPALACWGPGGYFGERPFRKMEWHQRLRDFHGKFFDFLTRNALPSVVYGVGVGPLGEQESRDFVRRCLCSASHVFVRDAQSYREALRLDVDADRVSVTQDAIFLLKPEDIPVAVSAKYRRLFARGDGRRKIGLHLQNIADDAGANMRTVVDCVEQVAANYDATDFYLIADNPGMEMMLFDLRARLRHISNVGTVDYCGVMDLVGALSCLDTVVTTKLHVGLCSFVLGGLPVSIYWHPKVLEQYKELGIAEQCCPVGAMSVEWLHEAFERAVNFKRGSLAADIAARQDIAARDVGRIARLIAASVG